MSEIDDLCEWLKQPQVKDEEMVSLSVGSLRDLLGVYEEAASEKEEKDE